MTTLNTIPTTSPRRVAEGEPALSYLDEDVHSAPLASAATAANTKATQGPSLTDEALAAASDLPPEGQNFHGTIREVREAVKANGNIVAAVAIVTDAGNEVDDVLLVKAAKTSPMFRASLLRARLYVDLSDKKVNLNNWAEAKEAMCGTRITFDVQHELGHDGVLRHRVTNVRGASEAQG